MRHKEYKQELFNIIIMKKLFLILFITLGIGAVYAGKNYTVTVTYELINKYISEKTMQPLGEKSVGTESNKFTVYAETPDEAESRAKSQCSTTCSSSSVYQGKETYNGESCDVYQYRRVVSARAL